MRQQITINDRILSFRQQLQAQFPGGLPTQFHGALSPLTRLFYREESDSYDDWAKKWEFLTKNPMFARHPADIENRLTFFMHLMAGLMEPVDKMPRLYILMTFGLPMWERFIREFVKEETVLAEVVNWILTDLRQSALLTPEQRKVVDRLIRKVDAFEGIAMPKAKRLTQFGEFPPFVRQHWEGKDDMGQPYFSDQKYYFRYVFQTNAAFRQLFVKSVEDQPKTVDSFETLAGLGTWFLGAIKTTRPWDADAQNEAMAKLGKQSSSLIKYFNAQRGNDDDPIDAGLIKRCQARPISEELKATFQFYGILTRQPSVSLTSLQNQFVKALQTDEAVKQLPCYLAAHYAKQHGLLPLQWREREPLGQTVYWLDWLGSSLKMKNFYGFHGWHRFLEGDGGRSKTIRKQIDTWNQARRQANGVPDSEEGPLSCVAQLADQAKKARRTLSPATGAENTAPARAVEEQKSLDSPLSASPSNPFSPPSFMEGGNGQPQLEMPNIVKETEEKEEGDWYGRSQGSGGSPTTDASPRARKFSPSMFTAIKDARKGGSLNNTPSQSGNGFGK